MKISRKLATALVGVALITAACGDTNSENDVQTAAPAPGAGAPRTVQIDMVDLAFEPRALEVKTGETVRFVFTNKGAVTHDAFIGDTAAQADHDADMRKAAESDDGHDHAHGGGHGDEQKQENSKDSEAAVTVKPGETKELSYTFNNAGSLEIGCHQPGHYAAGMKLAVEVA